MKYVIYIEMMFKGIKRCQISNIKKKIDHFKIRNNNKEQIRNNVINNINNRELINNICNSFNNKMLLIKINRMCNYR